MMKPFKNLFATSLLLLGCVASGCSAFTAPLHRRAFSKTSHELQSRQQHRNSDTRQPTHVFLNAQHDEGPDPSILIAAKDDTTQQLAVAASIAALAVGTSACINLWHGPGAALLGPEEFETIRSSVFPIAFGTIFAVVGVLHFVFVDNFAAIVPPRGTWGGLWQVPAPFAKELGVTYEEYHTYWSGIAEFLGGLYLLAGGLGLTDTQLPSVLLFLLTVGVTPANLYMFTHDAHPGGSVPRLAYPAGHITRFVIQCGLLSNFWIMAFA
jgi:uncharacterized membrane protein